MSNCSCEKGYYDSGISTTSCSECHPSCASCFGGSENECYECKEGNYFDGYACKKCHSSCSRCSGPNINQCKDCYTGNIIFEGRCLSTNRCVAPFTAPTCTKNCLSPCDIGIREIWEEHCFPPCPTGQISDFRSFCHSKFYPL